MPFLNELQWRGLLHDQTPGLAERLAKGSITGYVGFDPTAPSLQIGNLVPVMLLAHLQLAGGKPLVVIGGGTGLIGDPSGKEAERPLLTEAIIAENVERQREQFARFLDFTEGAHGAEMVNNADWLRQLELVPFLRDVGKHFTLSLMLQKESVKTRLEQGISYTEFSYMLLQAYDFLHLYRTRGCELQLGGSDQWGNITAGIELIRRTEGGEAHGVSAPLLATASGAKFGKTDEGGVWLDPELTSHYKFFQFWINVDDRDVERYLKVFTFKSQGEIAALMEQHSGDPGARVPHGALAADVTTRVHGDAAADRAAEASQILFGELDPGTARAETWEMLAAEVPSSPLPDTTEALELVASSSFCKSKSEARRLLSQGGIYRNGQPLTLESAVGREQLLEGGYVWLRRGKKTDHIFTPSV